MMLIRVQVFMVRASGDGCDFCAVMGDDAAAAAVAAVRNAIDLLRRWQPTLQVRAPAVSCVVCHSARVCVAGNCGVQDGWALQRETAG